MGFLRSLARKGCLPFLFVWPCFSAQGVEAQTPDLQIAGKIGFMSNRDANAEIYVMNADGTGQTRLTNNGVEDGSLSWSPDGSKIAFRTHRDGNGEVYVMNPDGTGLTRLTNDAAEDGSPSWSPDGSKIVFSAQRDGNEEIYTKQSAD